MCSISCLGGLAIHLTFRSLYWLPLHIICTNICDNHLSFILTEYGTPFHYEGADLHHALLGKGLGGGIAYVGVLCRPDYGYGLSASLAGSYTSMDAATVWDMKVFTVRLLFWCFFLSNLYPV